MPTCKAIVQEGPRKGQQCTFELNTDDLYCGRHHRNKIYDEGIAAGKRWCRFFFRGCDTDISNLSPKISSCQMCRDKKKERPNCQHTDCKFQAISGDIFCGQHLRDKYRLEEVEKGIKYCDIARGCFTILTNERASCESCLEKERITTSAKRNKRISQNIAISKSGGTDKRICVKCSSEFEKFATQKGKESHKCPSCFETQTKIELSRAPRERIYKAEMMVNMKAYYLIYINNAIKRDHIITLQFEEFCELVVKPCHYCGEINSGEVNGIDRINNDIGYTSENCAPCCEICNRMKHAFHPLFFIDKCKIICRAKSATPEFYARWDIYYKQKTKPTYQMYKLGANVRALEFNLKEDEFKSLIRMPCYLCGYVSPKGNGIDRVDNSQRSYDISNCKPCCWSCNIAKSDAKITDIVAKCARVATKWEDSSAFESVPIVKNTLKEKSSKDDSEVVRKVWKAASLYNAIKEHNYNGYLMANIDHVSADELELLSNEVNSMEKCDAHAHLKKFIAKINMRRKRTA